MKAIVSTEYGPPDVLQLREIEKPAPKADQLLIRVCATTVNSGDLLARDFGSISPRNFSMPTPLWLPTRMVFGIRRPRKQVLGNEFAGVVEEVGTEVTRFKAGDRVFGCSGMGFGAYAEYLCIGERGLVALKPAGVSDEEAAAIPSGALTALKLLGIADIQSGQRVLVNGASGCIGAAAVQLARRSGADVTGVCSAPRMQFVKDLGAHRVIDYAAEDFTRNGETYHLIFDILGKSSFSRCKGSLTENGRYLLASFKTRQVLRMLLTSFSSGKKVACALANYKAEDLIAIKEMVEAGEIKSIIDRRFPLEQTAEAHRYVESGQRTGSVVIVVNHSGGAPEARIL